MYDVSLIDNSAVVKDTLIPQSMWCYAQEGSFKQRLRQVRKSDKWLKRAQEHVSYIHDNFNADKINESFVNSIANLFEVDQEERVVVL